MSDLELTRFSDNNADIVLKWRNSERIRKNMLDDSIIKRVAHLNFLKNVNSDGSREYFVVKLGKIPVATLYFTGLGSSEVTWGCYIGTEKMIPGLFVALAIIAIEYSFGYLTTNVLISEVAKHNPTPAKLNRFLGIPETAKLTRLTSNGQCIDFIEYQVVRKQHEDVILKATKILPNHMKISIKKLLWSGK